MLHDVCKVELNFLLHVCVKIAAFILSHCMEYKKTVNEIKLRLSVVRDSVAPIQLVILSAGMLILISLLKRVILIYSYCREE